MPKHFNFPRQKTIRRYFRVNHTNAEKILWSKLRNMQLLGYKFRRQHGIEHYVVDFFCPQKHLAVEVDGTTHSSPEEIEYDKERQTLIEKYGICFVRVTNNDVYKNLDGVLHLILDELQKTTTNYYQNDSPQKKTSP